jgi:hypothetical protein
MVGQVAEVAADAPLQEAGIRPPVQHAGVVVGLQYGHVGVGQGIRHGFGHLSEVGGQYALGPLVIKAKPHRVRRVVGHAEGLNPDPADVDAAGQVPARSRGQAVAAAHHIPGLRPGVHRDRVPAGQDFQPLYMVRVLVGNQNAAYFPHPHPDAFQGPFNAAGANTRVDQEPGSAELEINGVAPAPAGQNKNPHHSNLKKDSCCFNSPPERGFPLRSKAGLQVFKKIYRMIFLKKWK